MVTSRFNSHHPRPVGHLVPDATKSRHVPDELRCDAQRTTLAALWFDCGTIYRCYIICETKATPHRNICTQHCGTRDNSCDTSHSRNNQNTAPHATIATKTKPHDNSTRKQSEQEKSRARRCDYASVNFIGIYFPSVCTLNSP